MKLATVVTLFLVSVCAYAGPSEDPGLKCYEALVAAGKNQTFASGYCASTIQPYDYWACVSKVVSSVGANPNTRRNLSYAESYCSGNLCQATLVAAGNDSGNAFGRCVGTNKSKAYWSCVLSIVNSGKDVGYAESQCAGK